METVPSIIGKWTLVAFESLTSEGVSGYPLGERAQGRLMYDADGSMVGMLMAGERPEIAWRTGTIEARAEAFDSYHGYCGTYRTDGNKVIHHVSVASDPSFVGREVERAFEVNGDRLKLITPPRLVQGREVRGVLTWERADSF